MSNSLKKRIENWLSHETPTGLFPLCDFESLRFGIRPGDVVLVEGRSRVAEVIRVITQSRWSHSALYLGRLHDIEDEEVREQILAYKNFAPSDQLLVEGLLGQGTVINSLNIYNNEHLRICRPQGLSRVDAAEVIKYAVSRVGTEYDFRQLLDLARFLFPWTIVPRRWRSTLFEKNAGNATKTVCSSMMAEAFHLVNYPILPEFKNNETTTHLEVLKSNTKLITPADFDYSPYFKILKFPFWGVSDKAHYRDLPWNDPEISEIPAETIVKKPLP